MEKQKSLFEGLPDDHEPPPQPDSSERPNGAGLPKEVSDATGTGAPAVAEPVTERKPRARKPGKAPFTKSIKDAKAELSRQVDLDDCGDGIKGAVEVAQRKVDEALAAYKAAIGYDYVEPPPTAAALARACKQAHSQLLTAQGLQADPASRVESSVSGKAARFVERSQRKLERALGAYLERTGTAYVFPPAKPDKPPKKAKAPKPPGKKPWKNKKWRRW
jgi:hypothetical protein